MSYDAIVIAGGGARRLGGVDKMTVTVGGRTLLDRTLAACADAATTTVVGPRRPTLRRVGWVREEPAGGGPLAALEAGLRCVTAPKVVVLAGDLPFLKRSTVRCLLDFDAEHEGAVLNDGRDQPLLAAYRTEPLRREVALLRAEHGSLTGLPVRLLLPALRLRRVGPPLAGRAAAPSPGPPSAPSGSPNRSPGSPVAPRGSGADDASAAAGPAESAESTDPRRVPDAGSVSTSGLSTARGAGAVAETGSAETGARGEGPGPSADRAGRSGAAARAGAESPRNGDASAEAAASLSALDCDTWEDIAAARARIRDDGTVLDEWTTAVKSELGIDLDTTSPTPEAEDLTAAILDLARDAAHSVARPAAPLTTFLVGYAAAQRGGSPEEVAETARRAAELAKRWAAEERP